MTMYFPKLRNGVSTMLVISSLGLCFFAKAGPVPKMKCKINGQDRWISCTDKEVKQKLCQDGWDREGNALLVPCDQENEMIVDQMQSESEEESFVPNKNESIVLDILSNPLIFNCVCGDKVADGQCRGLAAYSGILIYMLQHVSEEPTVNEIMAIAEIIKHVIVGYDASLIEFTKAIKQMEYDYRLKKREMDQKFAKAFIKAITLGIAGK